MSPSFSNSDDDENGNIRDPLGEDWEELEEHRRLGAQKRLILLILVPAILVLGGMAAAYFTGLADPLIELSTTPTPPPADQRFEVEWIKHGNYRMYLIRDTKTGCEYLDMLPGSVMLAHTCRDSNE